MASIKPYPFEQLKKYTEKEALLISRLSRFFPAGGFGPPAVEKIVSSLQKYLGPQLFVKFESLFESTHKQFVSGLPEKFLCGVVSLTPHPKKVIVEIDSDLTAVLIDKLLGGSGPMAKSTHPITPLEEGVVQFLLVKILSLLGDNVSPAGRRFRLDLMASRQASLLALNEESAPVVLMTFRVRIESSDAYIRLCLPVGLLAELGTAEADEAQVDPLFFEKRLKHFEHLRTVLWGEAGRVTLSARDFEGLEHGDIVLFDESYPTLEGRSLSGHLRLRIGDGELGGIDGKIQQEGNLLKVKVERIF